MYEQQAFIDPVVIGTAVGFVALLAWLKIGQLREEKRIAKKNARIRSEQIKAQVLIREFLNERIIMNEEIEKQKMIKTINNNQVRKFMRDSVEGEQQ